MPRSMVQRPVRQKPAEFERAMDAGMSQAELRAKFVAGDETINRWRDEIYIERAEKIRKAKVKESK